MLDAGYNFNQIDPNWYDLVRTTKLLAVTQFGVSAGHSREGRYASETAPPNATQIKLSDGVNPFDTGALAEGSG